MRHPLRLNLRLTALTLGAAALFGLGSCAVNPVSGKQQFNLMSESQEVQTGRQGDAEVRRQYGVYDDAALQARVGEIGRGLAEHSHRPNLPYRFTVLDSTEVNAFALPGGPIYITRGLLAYLNSEAQLAAVLGHEIGHVTARHGAQQYSATQATQLGMALLSVLSPDIGRASRSLISPLATAWLRGYGREHELEADRLGAEYLARTNRPPQAMVEVIGVLKNQELFDIDQARREGRQPRVYHGVFATHPDNDTRLREVIDDVRHLARDDLKAEPPGAFLARLDGLVWGDSPAQGLIRNGTFLHGPLGFGIDLPAGWRTQNTTQALTVQSPRGDAQLQLLSLGEARGDLAARLYQALGKAPGVSVKRATGGDFEAALSRGHANGQPYEALAFRVAGQDLLLLGLARDRNTEGLMRDAARASAASLRRLDDGDRAQLRPLRIHLVKLDRKTTYRELAKGSPLGADAEATLRLLNGDWPDAEPERGRTVKVIR
ncbi:MAG: peptidase M48 Ste24p [Rhodocyclaceae bacterium]|nr:peptidase M48 Ste24p [Rhodocyclaceae bacterium]